MSEIEDSRLKMTLRSRVETVGASPRLAPNANRLSRFSIAESEYSPSVLNLNSNP